MDADDLALWLFDPRDSYAYPEITEVESMMIDVRDGIRRSMWNPLAPANVRAIQATVGVGPTGRLDAKTENAIVSYLEYHGL